MRAKPLATESNGVWGQISQHSAIIEFFPKEKKYCTFRLISVEIKPRNLQNFFMLYYVC